MSGNRQLVTRIGLASLSVVLAFILIASPAASKRMDTSVLILLGAAAIFILVPWDKLASLKAVGVEITLNLPHVREAVESLDRLAQATGGEPVDNEQVRQKLERLGPELELVDGSRILWIDDNPLQIVGVRRLLRALGAEIVSITSTRSALELLERDNDFDLLISDLMRNVPEECVTFEWMRSRLEAHEQAGSDLIERDDGFTVGFDIRMSSTGIAVHQRREGVNFIVRLRADETLDPVARSLPVLFYASFPPLEASAYAAPADIAGFEMYVSHSAATLITAAVQMLASSRAMPIAVGDAKRLVKG